MPLKLLQAFCHVTCVYLVDLGALHVTGNAPVAHDVSCRLVSGVLCASLSVCSQSAGAAGEKSLHPPAAAAAAAAHHSQSTAKFGGAPPVYYFQDLLRIFTAKLLRVCFFPLLTGLRIIRRHAGET